MTLPDVLVDAGWVQAHLDDPGVVLVEVAEDTGGYDKGHIKGAVKLDWKQDLQDPVARGFIDGAGSGPALRAGHRQPDTVILYSGSGNYTPPAHSGTSRSTGTAASGCSTAAAADGNSTPASW